MGEKRGGRTASTLREYVDSLLVTVLLALFGTTFVLQAFKIPSSSMEDTLLVGDHLLVNKFVFAGPSEEPPGWLPYRNLRRGDIIVFKYPFPPHQHFVKRVIGLPGDRLKILNRQVYVNGQPLDEAYKIHRHEGFDPGFRDNFPPGEGFLLYSMENEWADDVARLTVGDELVIPADKYFAMGDNRDNSQDSRYWGFVDRKNIIGRPLLIYWSFDTGRQRAAVTDRRNRLAVLWESFSHFFTRTRWKRFLRFVR